MELKPCPFCGSNVDLMWWDHEHQNVKRWEPCDEEWGAVFPFVHCDGCDGNFDFAEPTGSKVAEAWNRRTNDV